MKDFKQFCESFSSSELKKEDPCHKLRLLDPESWKIFARKSGAMKYRKDKREKQRIRKEMEQQ